MTTLHASLPKIAMVCCTANRPKQLGNMIRCFERQDYPNRELVILDDLGQYTNTTGDRWKLVSVKNRFPTLGEKRNAATQLVSTETEFIAIADDDDIYLPWALSATASALCQSPLSRPSLVLHPEPDGALRQYRTDDDGPDLGRYLFHSGWGYRKDAFWKFGGYEKQNNGEDQGLLNKFLAAGIISTDPVTLGFQPFLIYAWGSGEVTHLSGRGENGYQDVGLEAVHHTNIASYIADPSPVSLTNPNIIPGINKRKF